VLLVDRPTNIRNYARCNANLHTAYKCRLLCNQSALSITRGVTPIYILPRVSSAVQPISAVNYVPCDREIC